MQQFTLDPLRERTKTVTMDLSQAAGTYDLVTANSTGGVLIKSIDFYVTVVGATFTSVAAQTNDTTAVTFLTSGEGAVANVTAGKNLKNYATQTYLHTSKKIQYTITGSTGTGTIIAIIRYQPSIAGADIS